MLALESLKILAYPVSSAVVLAVGGTVCGNGGVRNYRLVGRRHLPAGFVS
ncbi:MAG TPA: hypothetical protein VH500_06160 [Nitrososphaeraceae archaeon]